MLAAVLARRGIPHIVATDQDPRALACARENLTRLGFTDRVEVVQADLFPDGKAQLVVCNPPWFRPGLPLPSSSRSTILTVGCCMDFLKAWLHIWSRGGEGWLLLSDLAEHLELRTRSELLAAFEEAGLVVLGKTDVRPTYPRASDQADPSAPPGLLRSRPCGG